MIILMLSIAIMILYFVVQSHSGMKKNILILLPPFFLSFIVYSFIASDFLHMDVDQYSRQALEEIVTRQKSMLYDQIPEITSVDIELNYYNKFKASNVVFTSNNTLDDVLKRDIEKRMISELLAEDPNPFLTVNFVWETEKTTDTRTFAFPSTNYGLIDASRSYNIPLEVVMYLLLPGLIGLFWYITKKEYIFLPSQNVYEKLFIISTIVAVVIIGIVMPLLMIKSHFFLTILNYLFFIPYAIISLVFILSMILWPLSYIRVEILKSSFYGFIVFLYQMIIMAGAIYFTVINH